MKKKNEQSRDLNKIKHTNIYTIGVSKVVEGKEGGKETEERGRGKSKFEELMAENFPNLKKNICLHIKNSANSKQDKNQRVPYLDA